MSRDTLCLDDIRNNCPSRLQVTVAQDKNSDYNLPIDLEGMSIRSSIEDAEYFRQSQSVPTSPSYIVMQVHVPTILQALLLACATLMHEGEPCIWHYTRFDHSSPAYGPDKNSDHVPNCQHYHDACTGADAFCPADAASCQLR
jgi:hypothetical protein